MIKEIKTIDDLIAVQSSDGNWNYSPYMMGLLNGLICARSCLTGETPVYKEDYPKVWLADRSLPFWKRWLKKLL